MATDNIVNKCEDCKPSVKTAIDWSQHKEPWNRIGPAFAAECRAIMSGDEPEPQFAWTRLRKARHNAGILAKVAAHHAGIGDKMLYNAEAGHGRLSRLIVQRLADLYGVPFDYLAGAVSRHGD